MDDGTAVVLAASIPAACAMVGVIWQARKTRNRGTEEHLMARDLLVQHGHKLNEIAADVTDVKADVRELKATDRDHEARLHAVERPDPEPGEAA